MAPANPFLEWREHILAELKRLSAEVGLLRSKLEEDARSDIREKLEMKSQIAALQKKDDNSLWLKRAVIAQMIVIVGGIIAAMVMKRI